MASPIGQKVLDYLGRHSGATLSEILEGFQTEKEKQDARRSLTKMIKAREPRVEFSNRRYYLTSKPGSEPSPFPSVPMSAKIPPSALRTVVDNRNLLSIVPAFEEPVSAVPTNAMGRNLTVSFRIQVDIEHIQRIGYASKTDRNTIFWMSPGGRQLSVQVGDFDVTEDMELVPEGGYLVILGKIKGRDGYWLSYFQSPPGQRMATSWSK